MSPKQQLFTCGIFLKRTLQIIQSIFTPLRLLLVALVFCAVSASAGTLTWDAGNTTNGTTIDSASGAWDTDTSTNFNWNDGTNNVSWTQSSVSSPLNGATFNGPDASAGTYQVNVDDAAQVAATNLTINANGYVFSGSPIFLNGNGGHYNFFVADGKNVVISNNLTGSGNCEYVLGSNGSPASGTIYGTLTGFTPFFTSTNGSILYLAGGGGASIGAINADVRLTNGTYTSGSAFVIARNTSPSFPNANSGSFTVDGPNTVLNQGSDYIYLGRQGTAWNATFTIQNGATVNYQTGAANNNLGLGLPRPGSTGANCQSFFNMYGGTLNMGPGTESPVQPRPILLENSGSSAGQLAIMNQTGGVINAWSGVVIGGSSGSGSSFVTNSGGFLYIGSIGNNGIKLGTSATATNKITLSGGTVGTLQSWISSAPMTLGTLNGNITFQCADSSANSFNISLSGALTGPGGLNKTGAGVLTLTGPNNFAGTTGVSNGTLAVSTISSPTNGDVVVDGSAVASGLPVLSNIVGSAGQFWTMGNLTFAAGSPTLAVNFGPLTPSLTVAPIQVNGNLTFTVTPQISISGSDISPNDYPIIHYTGTGPGPLPVPALPSGVTATLSNDSVNKNIVLHVTAGPPPNLSWRVGNGIWDVATTANWKKLNNPIIYNDCDPIQFDDSATGTSPVTVTLNTNVNPSLVIAVNNTKAFIVSGTGSIGGSCGGSPMSVLGAGSLTLSTSNTYTGGTTVSAPGQLNINYGGIGAADSAIGTGTLNLNTGAKLDNTSGHAIVLNTATPIPINWNDDWTFLGSTNLDLGLGQVTLGNIEVVLTVVSNTLTVNNLISDNGNGDKLTKAGNGALTLSNATSTFTGGVDVNAGTLNINSDGSVGSGPLTLNGGALDNTSGADVTLNSPSTVNMLANFSFGGHGNLILAPQSGSGQFAIGGNTITLNGTNALTTEGPFLGGNRTTTVNGTGNWIIGGNGGTPNIGLILNGGTTYFNKSSGNALNSSVAVNTNASLVMLGFAASQMAASATITLGGGIVDMNSDSESIASVTFNSGILRNGMPSSASTLNVSGLVTLGGANCVFDVPAVDSSLTVSSATGGGGLVKTGLGTLTLNTNGYTGNTTISNGTLVLSAPFIGTNSTVIVATNATLGTNGLLTLQFPNGETNQVGALTLGGVSKPAGVYSATTDPLYIAGNGSLQVFFPLPPIGLTATAGTNKIVLSWTASVGAVKYNVKRSTTSGAETTLTNVTTTSFTDTTVANGTTYYYVVTAIDGAGEESAFSAEVSAEVINPLRGKLQFSVSGGALSLSWPTNAGWILQSQTNAAGLGLKTNWFTVAGSTNVTSTNFTINPANGSVFYRMVHP